MSKPKKSNLSEATSPVSLKTAENSDVFKVYVTDLSWQIAIAILAPTFAGVWLDGRLDSKPAVTLAGVLLGSAAAAVVVRRFLKINFPKNGGES